MGPVVQTFAVVYRLGASWDRATFQRRPLVRGRWGRIFAVGGRIGRGRWENCQRMGMIPPSLVQFRGRFLYWPRTHANTKNKLEKQIILP